MNKELLSDPNYTPQKFFNWVAEMIGCETDVQMGVELEIAPAFISRMRSRCYPIGPATILKIHDATGLPAKEIRKHMFAMAV